MKGSRIVFWIIVAIIAIAGGGLAGFFAVRGKVDSTFEIKPGLYGAKSGGEGSLRPPR